MNRFFLLALTASLAVAAQDPTPPAGKTDSPHPGKHEASHETPSAFEAEFVASDVFRSGSYVQPLWKGLGFEGHYFGGEKTDVGYTGGAWTFRFGELKLSPGFGVNFGSDHYATTPAFTFRWDYERGWFVTQGLVMQGFRKTPIFEEVHEGEHGRVAESADLVPVAYVRPAISDGSHVSFRWKRLTAGGTWEHIHFREGDEWKGGTRVAFRLLPRVSALLYVLAPSTEWRGGILIHPRQRE